MLRLVGEGYDFGFYAGTITRSDALDLSVEKGRVGQTFAQYLVHLFVGKAGPALQLFQLARFAHERKAVEVVLRGVGSQLSGICERLKGICLELRCIEKTVKPVAPVIDGVNGFR